MFWKGRQEGSFNIRRKDSVTLEVNTQEWQQPHRNWRSREQIFTWSLCRVCANLLTLACWYWFWAFGLQNHERINFCCFSYHVYGNLCWIVINIEVAKNKEFYWGSKELQFGRHRLGENQKSVLEKRKSQGRTKIKATQPAKEPWLPLTQGRKHLPSRNHELL